MPHSDDALFDDGSSYVSFPIIIEAAADALAGAASISVSKILAGRIDPGMDFSIGHRLYRVRKIESQSSVAAVLKIWPTLREDVAEGEALDFYRPVCKVRLATDREMNLSLELGRYDTPSVQFIEDPS